MQNDDRNQSSQRSQIGSVVEAPPAKSEQNPPPDLSPLTGLELPVDLKWPEIEAALKAHQNLVIVAEPGAGKTTRFPPALAKSDCLSSGAKQILMLEPRRLAARAAAARIAEEQGWNLGTRVGYQVRFENRTSNDTQLTILTEGLLSRRLFSDPALTGIGAVILDEFHERSLHTDLGLSLLFELQQLERPDLRLIVMSATLDAEKVAEYLGSCPIIRVPGRTHAVEIQNENSSLVLDAGEEFIQQTGRVINDLMSGRRARIGDVLAFLPGAREIRNVAEFIRRAAGEFNFEVVELHGSLALDEQNRALKRSIRPKVILATNIAETSLTIDGVNTVVDTGLARVMRVDSLGFPRLTLSRISKASSTQRAGRAGRQASGICYRLWNKMDEASMADFEAPEILRADLTEALMSLSAQGVTDFNAFTWFEKPRAEALEFARRTLERLGFIDSRGLTPLGREGLKLGTSPRLAKLLICAHRANASSLGSDVAALLSEKDILVSSRGGKNQNLSEGDLSLRLAVLHRSSTDGANAIAVDRQSARNVQQVSSLFLTQVKRLTSSKSDERSDSGVLNQLLFQSFSDRICRRRRPHQPEAVMVGGKGVRLAHQPTVTQSEFFFALGTMSPGGSGNSKADIQVTIASPLSLEELESFAHTNREPLQEQTQFIFDNETLTVLKMQARYFRDLPLSSPRMSGVGNEDVSEILIQAAMERWDLLFLTHASIRSLLDRSEFVRPGATEQLLTRERKLAFLEEICYGQSRLNKVLEQDLEDVLLRHLSVEDRDALEKTAPKKIRVPSGSVLPIQYPALQNPFLEVRIQEIFGWLTTPRLGPQKVPLTLHLLGPNYRPVQVTSDLTSFWNNGYVEVRKELRSRYPKHSWPDDPLSAIPEAKGRRRF